MNAIKHTLIALTALAMTGCASVSGLREKAPDIDITSTKSPAVIGQCVASGWGEFMGISVNHAPTASGGYSVSLPNIYSGTNGVMDIDATDAGSHVKVYYRAADLGGHGKFTKVVKGCI